MIHTKSYITHSSPLYTLRVPTEKHKTHKQRSTSNRKPLQNTALIQSPVTIAVIHVALPWVTPPCRERFRGARGAKDGKGQNEYHHLGATVERTAEDVVVLLVPAGMVPPEPDLGDDADDDAAEHAGVDTCGEVGGVLWGPQKSAWGMIVRYRRGETYRVDDGKGDGVDADRTDLGPSLVVKGISVRFIIERTGMHTLPMNHWSVVGTIPMSKPIGMTKYGPFGP